MLRSLSDSLGPLVVIAAITLPLMYLVRRFHHWKMRKMAVQTEVPMYRPVVPAKPAKSHVRR